MDPYTVSQMSIRYVGDDVSRHEMDMIGLGVSLQGFGRIYSAVGHFALTGRYVHQVQAMDVKALVSEPRAKCLDIPLLMQTAVQSNAFSSSAGIIISPIVDYIFAKLSRDKTAMDTSSEILKQVLDQQHIENEKQAQRDERREIRQMELIKQFADKLQPSARQAVSPIGHSCKYIDLVDSQECPSLRLDQARKDAIMSNDDGELTPSRYFTIVITEIDRERSTAKVRLTDEENQSDEGRDEDDSFRANADITDPLLASANNPYIRSLATRAPIRVQGKALIRDGQIRRLYISDAA